MKRFAMLGLLALLAVKGQLPAAEPVAMRMGSFLVAPSHLPPVIVTVKNLQDRPYQGTIRVDLPEGWRWTPDEQPVSLGAGESRQVRFTVKEGRPNERNSYDVRMTATTADGATVVRRQEVVCATAPYFKPQIDGRIDEWIDAIPAMFTTGGKTTTIRTYWNRRQFSILVAVEEDELIAYDHASADGSFDAVQLAISPQKTVTGTSPDEQTTRFEFLLVASGQSSTGGICFQLAQPGMKLAETSQARPLGPLAFDRATVAVSRANGLTYYECGIPFRSLDGIRPSEGREFFLSVLIHDPHGTGLRDWGESVGMFPCERNPLAWSRFPGAKWPAQPPFDNKTPWGMCSSKY